MEKLTLERLASTAHPMFPAAMELYRTSFPLHEQREAASQAEILGREDYHFDLICSDGVFVGEVLSWQIGALRYIEHFCILPEKRGRHYGQRALELLKTGPVLLEIDPPADEISRRRKHFYERCGFVENPYAHVHPPYHRGNHGHALVVMSSPTVLTQAEYDVFAQFLRDTIMKDAF